MRSYGQYCPISRASEVLAQRWTPLILRNMLLGCTTFSAIAGGVPGMSRSLLSRRLGELQDAGLLTIDRKTDGHGHIYTLTAAGRALWDVMQAMATWAERYIDLQPEHRDPAFILWAWCHAHLNTRQLPDRRVTVRFDFPDQRPPHQRFWILFEHKTAELCNEHPGFEEDLVVWARSEAFLLWHLGKLPWRTAVGNDQIRVTGKQTLCRALPTWNTLVNPTDDGSGS